MTIKQYKRLSQITDKYDVLLVDLWGVIHDGMVAYPGVNEALGRLKDAGKKVIFVSNAPRRAVKAIEGLRRVGVEDGLYDEVITSGEVVFGFLNASLNNLHSMFTPTPPLPPQGGGRRKVTAFIPQWGWENSLSSPSPLRGEGRGGGDLLKQKARELRNNPTEAEKKLWTIIKEKQISGHKFRRQHNMGNKYIADFICLKEKLIIELDGSQHLDQVEYDNKRTAFLEKEGYRVFRIWNNEIFQNAAEVWEAISYLLENPLAHPKMFYPNNDLYSIVTPTPTLPPQGGGRRKYIIIGPERDAGLMDGSGYIKVADVKDAQFMIVTGFDNDDSTMEEKQHYLDEAIKLKLPLICANPDLVVVRQTGQRALCAGVIAEQYAKMGGQVIQFGKPYAQIYKQAMGLAGNPDKVRVAAIGDSLITDILGANDFGIDSYFIPGGIFGQELGIHHGELPPANKLHELCEGYKIFPSGVLAEFLF